MLPPPQRPRSPEHTRRVTYESYTRDDGLFDIEAHMTDTKAQNYHDRERGLLAPGSPVHDISARVTIDAEMVVKDIVTELAATPFVYCAGGAEGARKLVGASLKRGWRKTLIEALGPGQGCTHLRELLLGVATVAFQTLSPRSEQRRLAHGVPDADVVEQPFFIGGCYGWAKDGPIVEKYFPQFHDGAKNRE